MLTAMFSRVTPPVGWRARQQQDALSPLARALNLKFNRIQFTPDLMPSDITGTEIIQEDPLTGKKCSTLCAGRFLPICFLLAVKSIARPPDPGGIYSSHARYQVTASERIIPGAAVFLLATQNPVEQEGTLFPRREWTVLYVHGYK